MLKEHTPYTDQGASYYEAQYRQRTLRNLRAKAARLGYCLQPEEVSSAVNSPAAAA